MLLSHTGNTGDKSVPDLAATTDFKIGTISACLPSTLPASANNWAGSMPINPPSLKSTCLLVCATPKQVPSSTITPLPTIIWCWNSLFWSPIKTIYNACMTKSVILISWRGFASKGPAVNGWWIWSLMWRGLFGKSGIIPSAEEHFFLHI